MKRLFQTEDGTIPRNVQGPDLKCQIIGCEKEGFDSEDFERHELAPGYWYWICLDDVLGTGLSEGK